MGFDPKRDALCKAETRQKIVEAGFRVFAERTIDAVNLTAVAKAAGLAMTTVYRYFNSKEALVLEVNTWVWQQYDIMRKAVIREDQTAAEDFEAYLEAFIDLYRNHRDILRFNQFFNIYVQRMSIPSEQMRPYISQIDRLAERFHALYEKARADGTLRTDVPEREIFSATMHLMLSAVTRYAIGLVYSIGISPEQELIMQKNMLLAAYRTQP